MFRTIKLALLALVATAVLSPVSARVGDWKLAGTKAISFLDNRDTIVIGKNQGLFSKVRLKVWGKSFFLRRMTIVFGNGDEQDVRVRERISAGEATAIYDVDGKRRYIKEIKLRYRADGNRGYRRSLVEAYGMEARAPMPALSGKWDTLATERVNTGDSQADFTVNGGGKRVVLKVLDRPVYVSTVKITFGNNSTQTIRFGGVFGAGDRSEPIDLDGNYRHIKRITVRMRRQSRNRSARIRILVQGTRPVAVNKPIPRGWKQLDIQNVNLRDDRFVLSVGDREVPVKSIRIRSKDNAVRIRRVEIVFGNGSSQRVRIRDRIEAGGETARIDLDGGARNIKEVIVRTNAQNRRRKTRLELIGAVAQRRLSAIPRGWKSLERQNIDLRESVFLYPVGRGAGLLKAIRLRSHDNTVRIRRVSIVFGNGSTQDVNVSQRLNAGDQTRLIDLDGKNRFIREVIIRTNAQSRRRKTRLELIGAVGRRGATPRPQPQPRGWKLVSQQNVNLRNNRFTFKIGRDAGLLKRLRIRTLDEPVRVRSARVTYGNGSSQKFDVNTTINAGGTAYTIKLRGNQRYVKNIVLRTLAQNRGSLRTRFQISGETGRKAPPTRPRPQPRPTGWLSLDEQTVNQRSDRFVLPVGRGEGRVSRIRLRLNGDALYIKDMVIVLGNGERQKADLYYNFRDGSQTPVVALNGSRFIREVILNTRSNRGVTSINLIGSNRGAAPPPPADNGDWVSVGTRRADMFNMVRDTYLVGRDRGRFTRIKLRAGARDIRVSDITVLFGDGSTQDVPISGRLEDHSFSQEVRLDGGRRGRYVESVTVRHKTKFNFRGEGTTEVLLGR